MAKKADPPPSGILVVDKPAGLTSHQVVGRIRRIAGTRKVGHAGTLDPMATGVLVIGIERATRLLGYLTLNEKQYRATIRLGVSTVTDDAEGEITRANGAVGVEESLLAQEIRALTGEIRQVPSAVSAIKINGVRSYARVRSGEAVELAARPVTVSRFDLLGRHDHLVVGPDDGSVPVVDLDVDVTCSSGTYIRALARDLGAALGTGGHLTSLRRTRSGVFAVGQAATLEQLADDSSFDKPRTPGVAGSLIGIGTVARELFPIRELDDQLTAWVRSGRRLPGMRLDGLTALLAGDGEFLALYRPDGGDAVPEAVFVS
ncbi:tRNA pseudouridine synthase B [Microlunatus endophyticus]|uniref:tRNA pseudouridine synthase B n=1 Tax=Microlunatus endophyticus TaxID=1716077 RepID=A0A917W6C1_9ACTN|nr:tRNA pseudouridine(55) synthase TruB [Microlunatus endophyticus]GGL67564.1 tRNA pseudouridine synthase B [Microlunatus endophyticus]